MTEICDSNLYIKVNIEWSPKLSVGLTLIDSMNHVLWRTQDPLVSLQIYSLAFNLKQVPHGSKMHASDK